MTGDGGDDQVAVVAVIGARGNDDRGTFLGGLARISAEEVAVVSGNKAFFMSCYSRCRPFCPSGGCSPDALWGRLVNEDI